MKFGMMTECISDSAVKIILWTQIILKNNNYKNNVVVDLFVVNMMMSLINNPQYPWTKILILSSHILYVQGNCGTVNNRWFVLREKHFVFILDGP